MIRIRAEAPGDAAAIEAVTRAAFSSAPHASGTEQHIVAALRRAGRLSVSLVALADDAVVGHAAISPVRLGDGAVRWYGLGPVSVLPAWQGRGIGQQLIGQALLQLRAGRAAGCVVLGEPGYYGRFGFQAHPGLVLPGVPPAYFQALAFDGAVPQARVAYDAAFEATA